MGTMPQGHCGGGTAGRGSWASWERSSFTFKEIDPLLAMVAVRREGEGCVDVIRDVLEAVGDIAGVVGVQGTIIEAPVLTALGRQPQGRVSWGRSCWAEPAGGPGSMSLPREQDSRATETLGHEPTTLNLQQSIRPR